MARCGAGAGGLTVEEDELCTAARVGAALDGPHELRAEVARQLLLVHVAQLCAHTPPSARCDLMSHGIMTTFAS